MINSVFVAPRLLNPVFLAVSPCVSNSVLSNSILTPSLCIYLFVWTPTLSLLFYINKDVLYEDMSACPHNGTVHGSDKQFRLHIVRVYDRQRLQQVQLVCPQTSTVQNNPNHRHHHSFIIWIAVSKVKKSCFFSHFLDIRRVSSTNEMHISGHKRGQMQLLQMWTGSSCGLCSFMLLLCCC